MRESAPLPTFCLHRPGWAYPRQDGLVPITNLPAACEPDAVALWATCGLTRPWNDPRADLDRALRGPSSTVLAALDAEHLVGTVMVGHDGHRGWVYYLAVDPGHRARGLGRALMSAAEEWLDARGIPKLQFMVRADNASVIRFYEHLGYTDQQVAVLGRFLDPKLHRMRESRQATT